jgi:hypothetical protein
MNKGTSKSEKVQEGRALENRCWEFLKPFLEELHQRLELSPFSVPNQPGRLSLLIPDADRLKCLCVSPNPRWLLNPPD